MGADRDPEALARAVAEALFRRDHAARALGMQLLEVRPGYARLAMRMREDMVNGHAIGHGGFTFILADAAFAYACNSRNRASVAAAAEIHFVGATRLGDELVAECEERHLRGRTGLYDVRVSRAGGELVALFRGRSHALDDAVLREDAAVARSGSGS